MGGAPDSGDLPAKELEGGDCLERPPCIFMVFAVRLESVDCDLVIDADKHFSLWYRDGEKGGDSFLHSVKLGIKHLSSISEVTSSFAQSVELTVTTVVDRPPTADCPIFKFGAVCVYDYCVIRVRLQPFFVEFFCLCRFVWVWGSCFHHSFHGSGCCSSVFQFALNEVFAQIVQVM